VSLLVLLAACLVIQLPAVCAVSQLWPDRDVLDRWIWGGLVGLAAAVYLAVAASYLHLYLFFPLWILAATAAIVTWARAPRRASLIGRLDPTLVLILALCAVPRFVVAAVHELPPGWDPTFHLVLARKILVTAHAIHDWRPFEDIALNYPTGSHTLVAVLAAATRLPLHTVFNWLEPILGTLTVGAVFLFGAATTKNREAARYAAAAYGLLANWGGIDYYRWGGLPNLTAMIFLLGALTLAAESPFRRSQQVLFAGFVAALVVTHHHVMLATAAVMCVLLVADTITGTRERRRGVVLGLVGAALLAAFFLIPYALKVRGIDTTSALDVESPIALSEWLPDLGPAFVCLAAGGLVAALASRTVPGPNSVAWSMFGALFGTFIVLEYVVRRLTEHGPGTGMLAFTPSRFLTDGAYVLAVFAGWGVWWLRCRLRWRFAAPLAMMTIVALGLTMTARWQHAFGIPSVSKPLWKAYTWIDTHTPQDTIVLARGRWSVYGTWRRTLETSIPASEPSVTETPKQRMMQELLAGARPPEAASVEVVAVRETGPAPNEEVLWLHRSGVAVVKIR
jgi:hypothetical protein